MVLAMLTFEMRQQVGPYVSPLESETRVYKEWSDGVAGTSHFVKCDVGEEGMTTTGGCPRTPDWMASGRWVKCAAGVGGDGDRIGGERGALALFKLDAQWKCYSITRTLSLVPDTPETHWESLRSSDL